MFQPQPRVWSRKYWPGQEGEFPWNFPCPFWSKAFKGVSEAQGVSPRWKHRRCFGRNATWKAHGFINDLAEEACWREKKNKHSCDQSHGSVDSVLTSHDSVLTATSDDFWALKKGSCCFFSKGTGNPFVEGKSRLVYADSMLHPSYITMFGWKQIKNCMSQNIQPHPQR